VTEGELTLEILRKLREQMRANCDSCKGTGKMSVPVWRTVEDQLDHVAGKDVTPWYTIEDNCGVCTGSLLF